jgi:hypothetical protein
MAGWPPYIKQSDIFIAPTHPIYFKSSLDDFQCLAPCKCYMLLFNSLGNNDVEKMCLRVCVCVCVCAFNKYIVAFFRYMGSIVGLFSRFRSHSCKEPTVTSHNF